MNPSLGTYIRERRLKLGLTQEQLAERIGDNLRQADVSRLERDRISLPRQRRMLAIAAALQVSLGELLVQTGWMEKDLNAESTEVAVDALAVDRAWAELVPKELYGLPLPELVLLLERIGVAEEELTAAGTALDTARRSVTAELRDQVDDPPSSNPPAADPSRSGSQRCD